MLKNPEISKLVIFALIGIVVVLLIAVILLAVKKNTIIYVQADGSEEKKKVKPLAVKQAIAPVADGLQTELVPQTLHVHKPNQDEPVRGCLISITIGNDTAEREITSFPCLIGRETDCDLVIGESAVSRKHARMLIEDGQLYIEDISGANGTFVNGQKISNSNKSHLHEGDRINLGRVTIIVQRLA